jgi:hypothetical protein
MAEPAASDADDFASEADYIDAVDRFTRQRLTPQELKIRLESVRGLIKIQQFLHDEAETNDG